MIAIDAAVGAGSVVAAGEAVSEADDPGCEVCAAVAAGEAVSTTEPPGLALVAAETSGLPTVAAVGDGSVDPTACVGGTALSVGEESEEGARDVLGTDVAADDADSADAELTGAAADSEADDAADAGADAGLGVAAAVGTATTITFPPPPFLVDVGTTTSCRCAGSRITVCSRVATVGRWRGAPAAIGAQSALASVGQTWSTSAKLRLYVPSSPGVSHATSPAPTLIGVATAPAVPPTAAADEVASEAPAARGGAIPASDNSAFPPITMTIASAASPPNGASHTSPDERCL